MDMVEPVVLIGAGGHAAVILEVLRLLEISVLGVLSSIAPPDSFKVAHLGSSSDLHTLSRSTPLIMGIGGVRSTAKRQSQHEFAKSLGFRFLTVVHPSAVVAANVNLGEGAQIMAGAIIQPQTELGANVIINTGAIVDHNGRIGDHVHVAPGAVLAGSVSVGSGTLIGAGANLATGVNVGAHTLIGAGSVVVRDIPGHSVAYGVPCRVVREQEA